MVLETVLSMWMMVLGCADSRVDEEAAQAYIGEWELQALASNEEAIADPVQASGELAVDEALEADLHMIWQDEEWAYELAVKGEPVAADAEEIAFDIEGLLARVAGEGGELEQFELVGFALCEQPPEGGIVCGVFAEAQPDLEELPEAQPLEVDLDLALR